MVVAEVYVCEHTPFAVYYRYMVLVNVKVFKNWQLRRCWNQNLQLFTSFSYSLCYEVCDAFVACFWVCFDVFFTNLCDPESVKEVLAGQRWKDNYKVNMVYAYENFLEMEGLVWQRPKYTRSDTIPFVPLEAELNQLIASTGKKLGTYLQGLKDTGADPRELGELRWVDVNIQSRSVTIKYPVKGHNPRIIDVSDDFIRRLATLPKKHEKVFNYPSLAAAFYRIRKGVAAKFANPRLLEISLTTFRHWKATMFYHQTKDILKVMKLLGHKSIRNTMKYIDLEQAIYGSGESGEYTTRVAVNVKGARALLQVGFEFVTDMGGYKIFRKRC